MRLGLCCIFRDQPIKYRTTTAKHLLSLSTAKRKEKLINIIQANVSALKATLEYCSRVGIGAFRINSQILPLKTHPELRYELADLAPNLISAFQQCGELAQRYQIRLSFHPDQFVVLNSPKKGVVENPIEELEYQSEVAEWVGADVINIHAGGAYGDKESALKRLAEQIRALSPRVKKRLTLENDDKTYTVDELLPLCTELSVPLVYDVHHHRCNSDSFSVEEATRKCISTWNREPLFHISSPIEGWGGPKPQRHHDFIDIADFPSCWRGANITVDVEAKAKELAVLKLKGQLKNN